MRMITYYIQYIESLRRIKQHEDYAREQYVPETGAMTSLFELDQATVEAFRKILKYKSESDNLERLWHSGPA